MIKKKNLLLSLLLLGTATIGVLWAADHIDAPAVTGTSADITDFYAFASPENSNNLVFVANTQGLLAPSATAAAGFDEDVLIEFNIDQDGDAVADLVIQATFLDGMMQVYGPLAPNLSGTTSEIAAQNPATEVAISAYGSSPNISTGSTGVKAFAGPRDDPFFMDFAQYNEIIAGNATGFNDPGSDTFAGTNVLSVVVEVPKSLVGSGGTVNTWVTTSRAR